jgi:hypothetical protein
LKIKKVQENPLEANPKGIGLYYNILLGSAVKINKMAPEKIIFL